MKPYLVSRKKGASKLILLYLRCKKVTWTIIFCLQWKYLELRMKVWGGLPGLHLLEGVLTETKQQTEKKHLRMSALSDCLRKWLTCVYLCACVVNQISEEFTSLFISFHYYYHSSHYILADRRQASQIGRKIRNTAAKFIIVKNTIHKDLQQHNFILGFSGFLIIVISFKNWVIFLHVSTISLNKLIPSNVCQWHSLHTETTLC